MPSLRPTRSPKGWLVIPTHYSHDPDKDLTWKLAERQKYTRDEDWNREQEIDFRTVSGSPAYPNWSDPLHIDPHIYLLPHLPLCVACDFNVDPCIWEVCQIVRGAWLHCLDEIALGPADVDDLVREFRNRYPTHTAPVWFYGDATGRSATVHAKTGAWDLCRLHMQGYPVPVEYRVPMANPPVKDRLGAVSARLRDPKGQAWVRVHPRCVELIKDGNEVVLDAQGNKELQIFDRAKPYHRRTHAFSAVGYLIAREWPLPIMVSRQQPKARAKPRRYQRILGSA